MMQLYRVQAQHITSTYELFWSNACRFNRPDVFQVFFPSGFGHNALNLLLVFSFGTACPRTIGWFLVWPLPTEALGMCVCVC